MRITVIALTFVLTAPLPAQSPASYHITHSYVLGGDGGWDYMVPDPPRHRRRTVRRTAQRPVRVHHRFISQTID